MKIKLITLLIIIKLKSQEIGNFYENSENYEKEKIKKKQNEIIRPRRKIRTSSKKKGRFNLLAYHKFHLEFSYLKKKKDNYLLKKIRNKIQDFNNIKNKDNFQASAEIFIDDNFDENDLDIKFQKFLLYDNYFLVEQKELYNFYIHLDLIDKLRFIDYLEEDSNQVFDT